MNWVTALYFGYAIIVVLVCIRIIYDTSSINKTFAYLLLAIFIPVLGIVFYFTFGINYRKRKVYSKKLVEDDTMRKKLIEEVFEDSERTLRKKASEIGQAKGLVNLLLNDSLSPLTSGNRVSLLINGEEKFPDMIKCLEAARHHIHIEYYIFEDDRIGNEVVSILCRKAREGVEVRFIYDGFGSRSVSKKMLHDLEQSGAEAFPFNRIRIIPLANRLNYRNHRKILIVDSSCGFVGGINISDKYDNRTSDQNGNRTYWRDTHIRIDGPGVQYLQYIFFCDWNFCAEQKLRPGPEYFHDEPVGWDPLESTCRHASLSIL